MNLLRPKRILIVGGGTAGWMTANQLLHAWPDSDITLVESAEIGTIGVGEGATPYLKQFFRQLQIDDNEWMQACEATYKVGINFENWSTVPGYQQYFHPFFSQLDKPVADMFFHNCGLRRRGFNADAVPQHYFVAAQLAEQHRQPVSHHEQVDIDYAYHFDATKLGRFLAQHAKSRGLRHILDTVDNVTLSKDHSIKSIVTRKHGELEADLYIDCTGFAGRLIQQALGEQTESYRNMLFNDAAVAIQMPYGENSPELSPMTRSIALTNGWMWQIPLTTRQGNGYVYSRDFICADKAETELRHQLGLDDNSEIAVRHLTMKVGRLQNHWAKNCLAVGLSQGFIEPLEATALMLTQYTVEQFILSHSPPQTNSLDAQSKFNLRINQVFDGIRDYIVAHYQLTSRDDTEYWRENANNMHVPSALKDITQAWDSGSDVERVLSEYRQGQVYLRPSWYCILAGMGRFPKKLAATTRAAPVNQAIDYCSKTANQYFPLI